MTEVSAEQARQTPWYKRSKEERRAIFEEREARRKERYGDLPSWGAVLHGDGAKFEGAKLSGAGVAYKGTMVSLPATARVESLGEVRRRVTATRLVMGGGIGGLLFRKKVDDRQLFLTVEGEGASFVVEVDPKKQKAAREFAAAVNSARSS